MHLKLQTAFRKSLKVNCIRERGDIGLSTRSRTIPLEQSKPYRILTGGCLEVSDQASHEDAAQLEVPHSSVVLKDW